MLEQVESGACVPFGLGRLPTGIPWDDPRLPHIRLGPAPLRLNTEPVAITGDISNHAGRIALLRDWLVAGSGLYAPRGAAFIEAYFIFVAVRLEQARARLREKLARYDGLYAVEDCTWSFLRPLPRAWVPKGEGMEMLDFAFWDGARLTGFTLGARDAPDFVTDDELHAPALLFARLGEAAGQMWESETLPSSPFRLKSSFPVITA
jgi:hypothetical protein